MIESQGLMMRFAERTGLGSPGAATQRYLWTDAFAVCNFLELGRDDLARVLVERVHHTLGRYRPGDARSGWLSGLDAAAGAARPTLGGLRIGKPLPERGPRDRLDERLEWDRDGQYFHYLTKWMHALDQLARATGEPVFNAWARELAEITVRTFAHGAPPRLYWKMSVDLSRPLVSSMGQHDPLDGYVTCLELAATAADFGAGATTLAAATAQLAAMIEPRALTTADPLGIGGLFVDAYRLVQLGVSDRKLVFALLTAARVGLEHYLAGPDLHESAERRLAFRELGLAIGLAAVSELPGHGGIASHHGLREEIEGFWTRDEHRATRTWREHADINDVMLATSLAPAGFLHRGVLLATAVATTG